MAALRLTRPVVYDVQFEHRAGRSPEGWPLEQIRAGGLTGLVAYACFYASRAARPHLVTADSGIGIDAEYCAVFWSQLAAFSTVPAVAGAMRSYVAASRSSGDAGGPLTVADGLAAALDPRRRCILWLRPAAQLELLIHAAALADELRAHFHERPGGPHPEEASALRGLDARLEEARAAVDAAAAACAYSVPATNRVLHEQLGEVRSRSRGALTPPSAVVHDAPLELADGLWSAPLPLLASQWTYIEARLFGAIPPWELLAAGWDRPRYEHAADAARGLVDHFNAGALWVTAEVLLPTSADARAGAIARWVALACALHRLRNYSAVFQISVGLRRDCVARLTETWALVPPAARERWALLHALTDDARSYRAYQDELRSLPADSALVPHLGAHTVELSMQDVLLPSEVPAPAGGAPHVHFRRHRELFGLQHAFFALQERQYTPEVLGPEIPQLVNGLNAAFRPYFFYFDEDRECAVTRMAARSEQLEPQRAAGRPAGRVG